jgi:hypothetical protein
VAVGLAEPAKVGHDEVDRAVEQRGDLAVVATRSRPPMQGDHRRAVAGPVVGEPEAVD